MYLDRFRKPIVEFDATNPEHVAIAAKVLSGQSVADAPFRFAAELPYTSGMTCAVHKMAEAWVKKTLQEAQACAA